MPASPNAATAVLELARDLVAATRANTRNHNRAGGVGRAVVGRPLDETELVERARSGATSPPTRSSCAHTRGSPFERPTCSRGTRPRTPRRRRRTASSRPTARSAASAAARRSALAAADRRQRGAEPPPLGGQARGARRARCRRAPPGGRGPVPRGGSPRGRARGTAAGGASSGCRSEHRDVIACRYFLELSEEETAAALGLRPRAR